MHHPSQHFNLSTALRRDSKVVFLGWAFYLPLAVIGVPPEQFGIAGLIVLVYQFWIRAERIGKLGWFDRVFGTFAAEHEPCFYGARSPLTSFSSTQSVLGPYRPLLRDAWHTRRRRDKLRVGLKPPGWQPADVTQRFSEAAFAIKDGRTLQPTAQPGVDGLADRRVLADECRPRRAVETALGQVAASGAPGSRNHVLRQA